MLKYLAFRIASAILEHLPLRACYALTSPFALIPLYLNRRARHAVQDNMRHAIGPGASHHRVQQETRRVFRTALLYYVDLLRMRRLTSELVLRDRIILHGEPFIREAQAQGRGIIFASAHFGNPELAIQSLVALGVPTIALTEPLHPPALSRFIEGLRTSAGLNFRPVSYHALKDALRALRHGSAVGVMIDRDIQGRSIVIDVCGAPATVPVGAVEFATLTGAAILPVFTHRRPDGRLDVFIEPPLDLIRTGNAPTDLLANVRQVFASFEPHIRADPGQWMALSPIWGVRTPTPGTMGYTTAQRERTE